MQVYVLPIDCREVAESKGAVEVASGLCKVERQRIESQIVSGGWKISRGARLKLNVSRRLTIDVKVDIQTGETYMLYKSYICATEYRAEQKGHVSNVENIWVWELWGDEVECIHVG